jgi:GNAT superfamily N-acetyltransferase
MTRIADALADARWAGRAERLGRARASEATAVLKAAADRAFLLGSRAWNDAELDEAVISSAADRHELFGWTASAKIVGCCLAQAEDRIHWPEDRPGEAIYLHKLAVLPGACGKGIGTALIHFAGDLALKRKRRWLRLDTLPGTRLVQYYEAHGFRADPAGPATFGSRWLLRMEQRLAGSDPRRCSDNSLIMAGTRAVVRKGIFDNEAE